MPENNHRSLLIIGVVAICVAMVGSFILEPPSQAEEMTFPEETSGRFDTVLSAEDLASPSPSAASATRRPAASPSPTATRTPGVTPGRSSGSPSPTPIVSHGGGLLTTAGSRFRVSTDAVEEAGGMKLIEGFQTNSDANLRDIRNTLLSSSSLVKGYKDGEEIGGFEAISTGTVIELSDRSGEVVDTAVVLMPGDVLGTGVLDITQIARVAAAMDGSAPLEGVYFMAGDFDGSGTIDDEDLEAFTTILTGRQERARQREEREDQP